MLLMLLNSAMTLIVVWSAWEVIQVRVAQYMAAFLIQSGLINGAFSALDGILFYSFDAQASTQPFGLLCVTGGKITRTAVQGSGGNPQPDDCSGVLTYDFNARIQAQVDPGLLENVTVCAQYWHRDPASTAGSVTSNALRFTIGP